MLDNDQYNGETRQERMVLGETGFGGELGGGEN